MIILQANDGGNFMMSLMMFIRNNAMHFEEFKIYSTIDVLFLWTLVLWLPYDSLGLINSIDHINYKN